MKNFINKILFIERLKVNKKARFLSPIKFTTSEEYWISRYKSGRNSGYGSYNNLAEFKGNVINGFVSKNNIKTIIELGCGDGNQLKYFNFQSYIGFDISPLIIKKCKKDFKKDKSKHFYHMGEAYKYRADLSLSLDVLFHLIEEDTHEKYLNQLFDMSNSYVIIYAFDSNDNESFAPHVKPRKFTEWINENKKDFQLEEYIPNQFPYKEGEEASTSFSDFFIYKRIK